MALALTYGAALTIGVTGWLGGPRLGLAVEFESGSALVTRVHPGLMAWEAGVRPGDRLLSIDGAEVSEATWPISSDRGSEFQAESGSTGKILRGSAEREAALTTVGMLGLQLVALLFAAMSLFVIARARRTPETRRFSYFALVAAIALALAPAAVQFLPLAAVLEGFAVHWVPVLFVGFFLVLGQDTSRNAHTRGNRLFLSLAITALTLDALWAITVWASPGLNSTTRPIDLLFLAGGLLGGVGLLVRRYRRAQAPRAQEQLRIITIGTVLGVVPFVVLSLIPFTARPYAAFGPELAVFAAVLVPLSFGYAVMRHELMGLRGLVHRSVAYALITLGVLIVYGVALSVAREADGSATGLSQPVEIAFLLLLVGGVPLISGVRRGVFAVVDSWLYKHSVDYPLVLRKVTRDVAVTDEFPGLLRGVLEALQRGLRLTFAAYVGSDLKGDVRLSHIGELGEPGANELSRRGFARSEDGRDVYETDLAGVGAPVLCAVVPARDNRGGLLCLGPKTSDEPFSPEDYRVAQIVTGLMSSGIRRFQLLEELRAKSTELSSLNALLLDVQEEERQSLAAFLHDSPLQKLSYATAQARRHGVPAKTLKMMQEVVEELRNVSSSLSPTVLDDFGLVRSLDWLCRETRPLGSLHVSFNYEGLSRSDRYPREIELAAYRIAQEALTNCQKHSKANWASVSLERGLNCVTIAVEDDGVGLSTNGPDKQDRMPTLGFRYMRQRAEQLGGDVVIADRPAGGVRVRASLPIQPSTDESAG